MDTDDKKKLKSQNETLHKLCLNRKKQNFQALKEWDQIRAHKLTTHRRVADEIDDALQTRIAESDQFLRVVMQFLSDRQTQQKKYEAQSVASPESRLQANSVSRNIHITTSECLTRLYKTTQNFKCSKKIRATLEQSVKKIQALLAESERDIMEIRTKIELKAVQIQNQNGLTIEKCDQLVAANKDSSNKSLNTDFDLFQIQTQFLQQTLTQTRTQQSYGQGVVQLLKCVQKYQKQKLELTRSCLHRYLQSLDESGQDHQTIKSMLDILQKRTQDQIIHIFYSSQEFLSRDIMRDIIKAECKDQKFKVDLESIMNFLTKITYHPFDSRNLVLKQYKTYLKQSSNQPSTSPQPQPQPSPISPSSQPETQLQNSYLLITIDGYLHIYLYKDQFQLLTQTPAYTIKCNSNIEMKREGDIGLELGMRKWYTGLGVGRKDGTDGIRVVFLCEDQREEFLEFVSRVVG